MPRAVKVLWYSFYNQSNPNNNKHKGRDEMILTENEIREYIDQRKPRGIKVEKDPMKYRLKGSWIERCMTALFLMVK